MGGAKAAGATSWELCGPGANQVFFFLWPEVDGDFAGFSQNAVRKGGLPVGGASKKFAGPSPLRSSAGYFDLSPSHDRLEGLYVANGRTLAALRRTRRSKGQRFGCGLSFCAEAAAR